MAIAKIPMTEESFAKGSHDTGTSYGEGPWFYKRNLFYHTGELPGGSLFHRSVCVAEFTYNEDGSIDPVEKCDGVSIVK